MSKSIFVAAGHGQLWGWASQWLAATGMRLIFLEMKKKFRKHIRLEGFDYSSSHYYFVTICTRDWRRLFEVRVSKKFGHELNVAATHASPEIGAEEAGRITNIVDRCLLEIPEHFPHAEIDFYVLMPDHLHLILAVSDLVRSESALGGVCPAATKCPSLGTIIGSFKSAASRLAEISLWQPNYYEHVIRSESSLDKIRKYILRNPWIEYKDINWRKLDPVPM